MLSVSFFSNRYEKSFNLANEEGLMCIKIFPLVNLFNHSMVGGLRGAAEKCGQVRQVNLTCHYEKQKNNKK